MAQYSELDVNELIRNVLGRYKLKYVILDKLIDMPSLSCFHVDMTSLIRVIDKYKEKFPDLDTTNCSYTITAAILNLCAHYRHYFSNRGWNPKIFIYVDTKSLDDDNIYDAYEFTKVISRYINRIYTIDTNGLDSSLCIKYFTSKQYNLVLTKNPRCMQLISDKFNYIYPNKDESVCYDSSNVFNKMTGKDSYTLNCKLMNIVQTFTGINKKYKGLKGWGANKTIKNLEKLIDSNMISSEYSTMEDFISDAKLELSDEDKNKLINDFYKIDVSYLYHKDVTTSVEKRLDSYIIDKFSNKDFRDLNVKYFTGLDSLMLNELVEEPVRKGTKW